VVSATFIKKPKFFIGLMEENKGQDIPDKLPIEGNPKPSSNEEIIKQNNSNESVKNTDTENEKQKKSFTLPKFNLLKVKNFYETQYKKLLIIPFGILFIALILLGLHYANTGDILNRDVSLKGGVTVTIQTSQIIDSNLLKSNLLSKYPQNDIATKTLSQFGKQIGIIIEADITEDQSTGFIDEIGNLLGISLGQNDYSIEIVGSSLGASFFREILTALVIAFGFMTIVVFIYFRSFIPGMAVILAALSDILITLAIVNLLGMKLSSAGIAAFLMLIGYSVDTDILLSSRVLKRREGTVMERIYGAMRTGLTMTITTLIAVMIALSVAQSEVIRQIMIILIIGLVIDLIMTWIQNVGILRMYLERKSKKGLQ
jgi:preprotein translocase subunit SecF